MMALDWLFAAVAAPFLAAVLAPAMIGLLGQRGSILLAAIPAIVFIAFAGLAGDIAGGTVAGASAAWLPAYDVALSFRVDGLSLLFALLISGIGTLIVVYAGAYLGAHPQLGRFLAYLFLFMGAMLGLVLADDAITLFVFWEGTSITSFLLIGFDHARRASRRAALQALVITGIGGLCLLAGLLLAGQVTGVRSLSGILAAGDALIVSPLYLPVLLLILGAAFTKSAQVPLHVWLPNAMEAPTPVSAYLHSATMVKAGVYLLMRLQPALGGTPEWHTILPLFGGATLLTGGILAIRQTDLKLMLAYTTVASLGLLVMLTGIGTELALVGAVAYLFAHSLFKGALFMVAGIIDHEAGTRDVTRLGGLKGAMPITFGIAVAAAISMAGLPIAFGFVAKEALYLGLASPWAPLAAIAAIAGNAMMFAIGFAVALKPFLGPEVHTPKHAHEGPADLWIGPAILAAGGLLAGLLTHEVAHVLIAPAASAVAGQAVAAELHLIPTYINAPLLMSVLTIIAGVIAYRLLAPLRAGIAGLLGAIGWGPDKGFDQLVAGIVSLAAAITGWLQHGRLDRYLLTTIAAIALAILVPMVLFEEMPAAPAMPSLQIHEWAVVLIAVLGLAAILVARNRLIAIVSLGIQGFAAAAIFMLFGAPDLAFTQFMVETLSVVILALVMTRLSLAERDARRTSEKLLDGSVAILTGAAFTLLLLAVVEADFDRRLTDFFEAYSYVIAHGRNIVNVIIVDFRGVDTLGEIAVVMVTGLAILALVRVKARKRIEALPKPATSRETTP